MTCILPTTGQIKNTGKTKRSTKMKSYSF